MNRGSKKLSHEAFEKRALKDSEVKAEFDALMKDFEVINELIRARIAADKTQDEIAQEMETTASVISRLESCGGKGRHSPTLGTLRKYAKAVGCELQVKLTPIKKGGAIRASRVKHRAIVEKQANK